MSKKTTLIIGLILVSLSGITQVKVGQWKDHPSYNSCNTVAKAGNFVYTSNGVGILKYNSSDGSVEQISKINGLSDIGIQLLRYNPYNNTLLVIYNNANIDILKGNEFINFSDIKRKTITGKKNINEVTFKNNIAYLACGFGIVVFDTDKLEVKDTYYIGPGGAYLNVYQVELTDTAIIAATTAGLYRANTSTLLNNFQNWSVVGGVPPGTYNGVVKYGNKLMANYSPWASNGTQNKDTLYSYDGTSWKKDTIKTFPYFIRKLIPYANYFALIDQFGFEVYNLAQQRTAYITQYAFGYSNVTDVSADFSKPEYWIADMAQGFIKSEGPYPFYPNTQININGTHSNYVNNIDVFDDKVISSPTKIDETGTAHYSREGMNLYADEQWNYIKESVADTLKDYCFAYIDRKDPSRIWASSWLQGLCEYRDGQLIKVYNSINAAIPALSCCADWHRAAGLSMDETGNLWIGGSDVQNFLTVRKTNGTFQNFNFSSGTPFVSRVLADKNNQIWVIFPRSAGVIGMHNGTLYSTAAGLAVYKNNNFAAPGPGNFKFFTLSEGQGKLPDPYVFAIAEDHDGQIWIGTNKGLAVFYNPENIFTGANYDAQQILITQDNHVQILLETEKVTAIAIDGANRKWVGTEASGVFCFSPDGQEQIYHFTADDSPLFSNVIHDIGYDEKTGDVFIGSDQGIQSYRTVIIKGEEECIAHAYPNPVRPGYNGNVYVRGLLNESVVKITDINSNLVWETKSQGGQIEWALKNIQGKKVAPGVYMASCSLADGNNYCIAKILVLN
jgi:ligand-binding sensor domain-containing protein